MTPEERAWMTASGLLAGWLRHIHKHAELERRVAPHIDMMILRAWHEGATDQVLGEALGTSARVARTRRERAVRRRNEFAMETLGPQPRVDGRRRAA